MSNAISEKHTPRLPMLLVYHLQRIPSNRIIFYRLRLSEWRQDDVLHEAIACSISALPHFLRPWRRTHLREPRARASQSNLLHMQLVLMNGR
ncbi:hypothetical protein LA080_013927 [Diaporthe eres]|nr:hypothetical protein LA080_013927 [Diaporthe eres]